MTIISLNGFAQTIPKLLERVTQSNDPMPSSGKFKGQKVENQQRRTIVFLNSSEKKALSLTQDEVAFANFRHNGSFFIASIDGLKSGIDGRPLKSQNIIEKIVLSKKHWAGKTRPDTKEMEVHAELIFYFKAQSGVKLHFNQNSQLKLKVPQRLGSLVLSIEAIRSSEESKSPFFPAALGSHFAIGHRILSLHERNTQHRDDPERTTSSYRLNFADTKSKREYNLSEEAILMASLEKSHDLARKQAYNMFNNNCTNNIFRILDENLIYNQSSTGLVNYQLIKEDIVSFVHDDLEVMMNFVENLAQQNQSYVDLKSLEKLRNYLHRHIINRAEDIQIKEATGVLLYQVPAFIDGHLKARGLIK
jgi:hypothetical protein